MIIEAAISDAQIAATWNVMRQLRPHLVESSYVPLVQKMREIDGYRLVALLENDVVRAVAGYRFMNMLYCGALLYIDDLVTDEQARSKGYGARLLAWLEDEARRNDCSEMQLISKVTRESAHRFYFREGFAIECFEFRKLLRPRSSS